jgi:hypothetical protein
MDCPCCDLGTGRARFAKGDLVPDTQRSTPAVQAWVESPLQLLSVIEAHAAGLLGPRTTIVPRADVVALALTTAHVQPLGLPVGLDIAAPSMTDGAGSGARGTWVVGDVFSGRVQRSLILRRPDRVVVVDDGRATLHLLACLTGSSGTPFLRARAVRAGAASRSLPGAPRRILGALAGARLRDAAAEGRLTIVTACPVEPALEAQAARVGVTLVRHRFGWLRATPCPGAPEQRTVVLGSAMVRDALLRQRPYLDWVSERAAREPLAYFPHRREDSTTLAHLRRQPGVEVYEPGVPVELSLRGLSSRQRVFSLPSTAALTLRSVLADRGTQVVVDPVPNTWWTDSTSAAVRAHLGAGGEPAIAGTTAATGSLVA